MELVSGVGGNSKKINHDLFLLWQPWPEVINFPQKSVSWYPHLGPTGQVLRVNSNNKKTNFN